MTQIRNWSRPLKTGGCYRGVKSHCKEQTSYRSKLLKQDGVPFRIKTRLKLGLIDKAYFSIKYSVKFT
jgi:hypothetical protein